MAEQKIHISIQEDDTEFFEACKWFDVIKLSKQQKNEFYRMAIIEYLNSMQGMEYMRTLALQKKATAPKKPLKKQEVEKQVEAHKKQLESDNVKKKTSLKPLSLSKNKKANPSESEQVEVKPYTGFDDSLAQNEEFLSLLDAIK